MDCELSTRASIRAFDVSEHLLLLGRGRAAIARYEADVEQSRLRTFPPQFNLLRGRKPGLSRSRAHRSATRRRSAFEDPPRGDRRKPRRTARTRSRWSSAPKWVHPVRMPQVTVLRKGGPTGPTRLRACQRTSASMRRSATLASTLPRLPQPTPTPSRAYGYLNSVPFGGIAGFRDLWVRVCRRHD
jgi:hypothetical protein